MILATLHRGMGYSKDLVTLLSLRYDTHIRHTIFLMSSICSWYGLAAKTVILPYVPSYFSIQSLASNEAICSIIIGFSCGPYLGRRQHTGFEPPVAIENRSQG